MIIAIQSTFAPVPGPDARAVRHRISGVLVTMNEAMNPLRPVLATSVLTIATCSFAQAPTDTPALYQQVMEEMVGYRTFFSIEEGLKEPQAVQWLSLSQRELKQVPKDLLKFPNLKVLDLSYNELTSLPSWFGKGGFNQ